MCCCCWTGVGLLDLVTNEETIQFALGFIIGEAFGALITSIVTNIVSPVIGKECYSLGMFYSNVLLEVALGKPGWTLYYKGGELIIANPGAVENPEECDPATVPMVSFIWCQPVITLSSTHFCSLS